MSIHLYYFTGTGSSLSVARDLSNTLENTTLVSIPQLGKASLNNVEVDVIGFVFPVYYLTMPTIVEDFINRLTIPDKTYIFSIVTSAGDPGNTFADLNALLQAKGSTLNSGFSIPLADNSVALSTSKEKYENRLNAYDDHIKRIAKIIGNKGENFDEPISRRFGKTLYEHVTKFYLRKISQINKKSVDDKKCNKCEVCVNVCPTNNITLDEGGIAWSNYCVECFGCIHGCHVNAITFGKLKRKDNEAFRHPSVKLSEIINANQ